MSTFAQAYQLTQRCKNSSNVISISKNPTNAASHRVFRDGHEIKLSPTEFRLLFTLMERQGRFLSRDQLLDYVWGGDIYVDTRTVDVHIGRLRKSLVKIGHDDPIGTIRGVGYALG